MRSCEHFRGFEDVDPEFDGPAFMELLARLDTDVRFQRVGARPDEQRRLVAERLQALRESKAQGRSSFNEEED